MLSLLRLDRKQKNSTNPFRIGHLHDGLILLLRPESFGSFLSCENYRLCYLNLPGITKFKCERKNEKNSGHSSKMTPSCKWPIRIFLYLSYSFGIETINTFIHSRSSLENHTRFQTKTAQKPYPLGGKYLYNLCTGVPLTTPDYLSSIYPRS